MVRDRSSVSPVTGPARAISSRCRRQWWWSAAARGLKSLVALLAAALVLVANAGPAAADTTVDVATPLGQYYQPGTETILLVTVTADQAVTGTIDVLIDGEGSSSTTLDIEVPGGSAKTFSVPVALERWNGQPRVVVSTSDGTTRRPVVNMTPIGEAHPIAVFPSLVAPGLVERADLTVDTGQARLLPFDPSHLDNGASVLNPAAAVVADSSDLTALNEVRLDRLMTWVSLGGALYVDGTLDEIESGPIGQRVADAGARFGSEDQARDGIVARAWIGGGTIFATGDALNSGRYDGLFQPRFWSDEERPMFSDPGQVLSDLSVDAGFRVRPIGPFVAVLLAYIAIVGPLLWLFLSRSRREPLMWLAVPAVAVVASLGIWGSGQFFRQGTTGSHVTVIGSVGTASRTVSDYMISSSGGGFTGVRLAEGWAPAPTGFSAWDWRFQEAGLASPTIEGTRIGADVPPAGVVVLGVASSNPTEQPWTVELAVDGSDVTGTITNRSGYALTDVMLFSGDRLTTTDDIEAGGSSDFDLRNIASPPMWEDPVQMELANRGGREGESSPAALSRWMRTFGLESRTGQITVVGWTREPSAPLDTLNGSAVTRGRTGYMATFSVFALADDGDGPASVSAATIRSRIIGFRWSGDIGGGLVTDDRRLAFEGEVQTLAFELPPGASDQDLFVDVPDQVSAMDLWDGQQWIDAGVGSAPAGRILVPLPPSSVAGGSVYLRALSSGPLAQPWITSTMIDGIEVVEPVLMTNDSGSSDDDTANSDDDGGA